MASEFLVDEFISSLRDMMNSRRDFVASAGVCGVKVEHFAKISHLKLVGGLPRASDLSLTLHSRFFIGVHFVSSSINLQILYCF